MLFQKGNQIGPRFQKGNPSRLMPVEPRLERYSIPEPNSGCQLWIGSTSTDGYGLVSVEGRLRGAHVVSYELAKGPVPEGLVLDHLCRVRACINPDHLEPVTHGTNIRRGTVSTVTSARNASKHSLTCPHGHTTVVWYVRKHNGKRQKRCWTCDAIRKQKRRLRCQTVDSLGPT